MARGSRGWVLAGVGGVFGAFAGGLAGGLGPDHNGGRVFDVCDILPDIGTFVDSVLPSMVVFAC